MDLDEVADELYGVPPEDFVAARRARQEQARADGDRALAKEIGALPRPATAAWACNLLVRHEPDQVASLAELGGRLREAQQALAGEELRALDVQRRRLVSALTRQARSLAGELGHPVSSSVALQVEETLRAAMADEAAGRALLTGRLTGPLAPGDLGGFELGTAVARPDLRLLRTATRDRPRESGADGGGRAATGRTTAPRDARQEEQARRAAEEQRRRELEEARKTADRAAEAAEEAEVAAESGRQVAEDLRKAAELLDARIAELTEELARTQEEATRAGAELRGAERRARAAERAAAEAAAARDRALARVADLTADDGG